MARAHSHPPISASVSGRSSLAYSIRAASHRWLIRTACRRRRRGRRRSGRCCGCCRRARSASPASPTSRPSVGVRAGKTRRQISARWAASGNGNWTTNRMRRRNAGSRRALQVGRQDGQAAIGLHPLQQVADLDVGVAVVAVLDLAPLAEEGVGLVEEEDRAAVLGRVEDPAQVLLGLADVLADHAGQVDPVQVQAQARCARTSAAIVLPVPLAPAKRALMPRPRADLAAKPQES